MKRVRWGILSTAGIAAQRLIPAIRKSASGEIYAVASRNASKADSFAKDHRIPKAYSDYDALLKDPDVDAVYCPLPTGMHHAWALECAHHGKPLLCEKPVAACASDAEEIFDAFNKANLLVSEAYMYLYHPLNHKVRELVYSGRIGTLRSIQTTFNVNLPRTDIRFNSDLGGGALLDLGCYCVGISRFLAGNEPVDVQAMGLIGSQSGVDEMVSGSLLFPDDVVTNLLCSLTTFFECRYEVYGNEGRIRAARGGMIPWPGESFCIELWSGEDYEEIIVPECDHYCMMVEDFNQAVLTGRKTVVSHGESLANLKVLDRLRQQLSKS